MFKNYIFAISSLIFLVSCGGGGGGGGGDPVAPSPPTPSYSIASGNIYTTPLPGLVYIDENMNGFKDSYELSVSPASNGSFSFVSTDQSKANCLKNYPIMSDSPLLASFNFSQGQNIVINPFTTIFKDNMYSFGNREVDYSKVENDNINCSNYELYIRNASNNWLNDEIKRMEAVDNHTYIQIAADPSSPPTGSAISNQRSIDLNSFYNSLKTIESQLISDFNRVASSAGVTFTSRVEVDSSALRIFLNKDSYPNPSTDLYPVANNIESIALQTGIELMGTLKNYTNSYDNTLEIKIDDMHISNNGLILQDTESCWINFSSLCKVDASFENLLLYASPTIVDTLHKTTSRGEEALQNTMTITDSSSLNCYEYDRAKLTDTSSSDAITVFTYHEYLGDGNFNVNDLNCYAYGGSSRGASIETNNVDGTSYYVELWNREGFNYLPSAFENIPYYINYEFYDDEDLPPTQLPQSYINTFIQLGSGGWSSFDKLISEGQFFSSYTTFYMEFRGLDFGFGYVYVDLSNGSALATCKPIDGDTVTESISWSDIASSNIFDTCRTQLVSTYTPTSEKTYRAKSPYRGYINE